MNEVENIDKVLGRNIFQASNPNKVSASLRTLRIPLDEVPRILAQKKLHLAQAHERMVEHNKRKKNGVDIRETLAVLRASWILGSLKEILGGRLETVRQVELEREDEEEL